MSDDPRPSVNRVRFYAVRVQKTVEYTVLLAVPTVDIGVHKDHDAYRAFVIKSIEREGTTEVPGYTRNRVRTAETTVVLGVTEVSPEASVSSQLGLASPFEQDAEDDAE